MAATLNINQVSDVITLLEKEDTKLVYIAGASASGKSYFARQLAEAMRKESKKVLELSSDDYYTDQTGLKFVLYGTFDHPNLIEYDLLQKNLHELFKEGKTKMPKYSFKERRRTHYEDVTNEYDYILVEGLYTIDQLSDQHNPFKIFVDSALEELVFRRIVRDQERLTEPIDTIVTMLGKVFPMWKLYGMSQKENTNIIIHNDYAILDKAGQKFRFEKLKKSDKVVGELHKREYIKDFIYDDSYEGNGRVIISEIYRQRESFLDSVMITKLKEDNQHNFEAISVRLYQPGLLTAVHTLLQTAGLTYIRQHNKVESVYKNGKKTLVVKESDDKLYVKKEVS